MSSLRQQWSQRVLSRRFSLLVAVAQETRVWTHLAWRDLRVRFSRTRLGPWWSTLSQGVLVAGISTAAALIAGEPVKDQLVRVAVSLMIWTFIANVVLESVDVFSLERGLLLNTRIDELSLSCRVVWRQILLAFYNLPIPVVCAIAAGSLTFRLLLLPFLVLLTGLMLVIPSFIIGYVTLLRRDFVQIIPPLVQFTFFLSPVMWEVPQSGRLAAISSLNPVSWILETVRGLVIHGSVAGAGLILCLVSVLMCVLATTVIQPLAKQVRLLI